MGLEEVNILFLEILILDIYPFIKPISKIIKEKIIITPSIKLDEFDLLMIFFRTCKKKLGIFAIVILRCSTKHTAATSGLMGIKSKEQKKLKTLTIRNIKLAIALYLFTHNLLILADRSPSKNCSIRKSYLLFEK